MVCKWTGLRSSKAEVMVNHMDNIQLKFDLALSLKTSGDVQPIRLATYPLHVQKTF